MHKKWVSLFLLFFCFPLWAQKIPDNIFSYMQGKSWQKKNAVQKKDLVYLQITYYGFDGNFHPGELIVHKQVAQEVLEIFDELYHAHFPLQKVQLIDKYQGSDELSMADNNSSAFCTRPMTGEKNSFSKHSYGIAIDINPVQNPYVKNDLVLPAKGNEYLDRRKIRKGMIVKDNVCYKAFTRRGWKWGGDWRTLQDYQHFEKDI